MCCENNMSKTCCLFASLTVNFVFISNHCACPFCQIQVLFSFTILVSCSIIRLGMLVIRLQDNFMDVSVFCVQVNFKSLLFFICRDNASICCIIERYIIFSNIDFYYLFVVPVSVEIVHRVRKLLVSVD